MSLSSPFRSLPLPARLLGAAVLVCGFIAIRASHDVPVVHAQDKVDFASQIEPIFAKHCYECHGPEKGRGKLRLHVRDLALKGGATGPLLVPGNSEESYIITRLLGKDDDDQMPLDEDPLSDEEIALIRRWIDEGAEWPVAAGTGAAAAEIIEHWAYVAPAAHELPEVTASDWPRTPVDRFVLAQLDTHQLAPSPDASKETLLRRVSLDLIGLPPTVEELDAFLADTRDDAYERAVDRLLASPHYGERWARLWLDLARYADTHGLEKDGSRSNWAWRDWVVKAFNDDMPFDQFTVEQIAGDMLPSPTREQLVATGFHRNTMLNEEGGVDPDESRYEVLVDRVNTTSTVWLGSTLACAQCHNHKYDPFSQKEYFQMMAFFSSADYTTRPHGVGTIHVEPTLDLATPEQETARAELQEQLKVAEAAFREDTPERQRAQIAWEREQLALVDEWTTLTPERAEATGGVTLQVERNGEIRARGENATVTVYEISATAALAGATAVRLEALLDEELPKGGPGRDPYGHFRITGIDVLAAPASSPEAARRIAFTKAEADGNASGFRAEQLIDSEARGYIRKGGGWAIDAMRDGWRVPHQIVLVLAEPIAAGSTVTVRIRHEDGTLGQGLGRFRLSVTNADAPTRIVALPARVRAWAGVAPAARTEQQANEIAAQFRALSPLFADGRQQVKELRESLTKLAIPSTLVMGERASFERPSTPLYERGAFTSPGERVYAATPGAFPPMGEDLPVNRLGLARWLVSRDNPLTARVTVNRFWETIFGRGLVETSEDFGTMASPPSHPELLDWLATSFMDNGWRIKPLLRTIVLSSTYRQQSDVSPDLLQRDPYNRLLARGPRVRLEAEAVRDLALAASGKLAPALGGPSVFPPQPDGIWDTPYNSEKWIESEGDDRYRRSLYTFIKRSAPYPLYTTFDATSREFCTVRRVRTNTPLQALATLNDEGLFELSRALGTRIVSEAKGSADARIAYGFRLVTGRSPDAAELDRLREFQKQAAAHYAAQPDAAARVLGMSPSARPTPRDIELAAWTMVGNVLLNLDEVLTKG